MITLLFIFLIGCVISDFFTEKSIKDKIELLKDYELFKCKFFKKFLDLFLKIFDKIKSLL